MRAEPLEQRQMLATFQLVAINPSNTNVLSQGEVLNLAPDNLLFRFNDGPAVDLSTVDAITIERAGFDGDLDDGANVIITPGFVGRGETDTEVITRFAEPLPDDLYRITVDGTGADALRDESGQLLNDGLADFTLDFELDLGALVTSVVPMPVTRDPGTLRLLQDPNSIIVYFNEDSLNLAAAQNPEFYQLIFTNDTVGNNDDELFIPDTVVYTPNPTTPGGQPLAPNAVLTFGQPLYDLPASSSGGTFRLRIGTDEEQPAAPDFLAIANDPGSSFADAVNVDATFDAGPDIVVTGDGSALQDGQTITLTDTNRDTIVLEFDIGDGLTDPNNHVAVPYNAGQPADAIAGTIRFVINAQRTAGNTSVLATANGNRVELADDLLVVLGDGAAGVELESFTSSAIFTQIIEPQEFPLDFPGSTDEPGHRDINLQSHLTLNPTNAFLNDITTGITQIFYNFQNFYGFDAFGNPLLNLITPEQKDRAREVFEIYGELLGIDFVESAALGFTIATGDLRAVRFDIPTGPGGAAGASRDGVAILGQLVNGVAQPTELLNQGLAVMDNAETWNDNFGGNWFQTAMHQIGELLGLGQTDELAAITIMGDLDPGDVNGVINRTTSAEPVFPGPADIVHGQHRFRPDSKDIDIYQVAIQTAGVFTVETFAERLPDSSLLDSAVRVYRENADGTAFELIAQNDDYFSEDSYIEVELDPGVYYIGVSASGNTEYNPLLHDSGIGGTSQGPYQLRMNFRPIVARSIIDQTGQEFDGDGDGVQGGVFNFWFRATPPTASPGVDFNDPQTFFVDKLAQQGGSGTLLAPFREIDLALARAAQAPGSIVRVIGNGGSDNNFDTLQDNTAYVLGIPAFGQNPNVFEDGVDLRVPKDVTVMVDAGAIFKMRRSTIVVGSTTPVVDRSGSVFQVLGTPDVPVFFTSSEDDSIGNDITTPPTTGSAGDWGGILFREDVDAGRQQFRYANEGIFLNYINHADIRHGGGLVTIDGVNQTVNPITMIDSRPTITYNDITLTAGAAMTATPNSFEESNFSAPQFQLRVLHTADYFRIGPEIRRNTLAVERNGQIDDNSINGLSVIVDTPAASDIQKLTVPGRFDDTDIVHFLGENLIIDSLPGGPLLELTGPSANLITLTPVNDPDGQLQPGIAYQYRIVFVDAAGNEGIPSTPTRPLTLASQGSIRLSNLPPASGDFVARRIYRTGNGGITFDLVAQIPATGATFVDNGTTAGGLLVLPTTGFRARGDGRLRIDPSTVVKLNDSYIEVSASAQLIAEARDGNEVIFTSLFDDRYGGGGTFDTGSDGVVRSQSAGDWGGIFAGPYSHISLDHAIIAHAGGVGRIEGDAVGFSPIDLYQANARITNSVLENNDRGSDNAGPPNRFGRGAAEDGAIQVRGAQPVIIGNIIRNNQGPAININANSLNSKLVTDPGRSTGFIDRFDQILDNQGPLIRDNLLASEDPLLDALNGMLVRGEILSTQVVMDDTDIVHVIQEEIVIPDFHSFGGLRLESRPEESLVVKLLGPTAGITAGGRPLDIDDRVGGAVQIVGQPNSPVVLTSLRDSTIGAGVDPQGRTQVQTLNDVVPPRTQAPGTFQIDLNFGPNLTANQLAAAAFQQAADIWEAIIEDPITVTIDAELAALPAGVLGGALSQSASIDYDTVRQAIIDDAGQHEQFVNELPAFADINVEFPVDAANPYTLAQTSNINTANAKALGLTAGLPQTPSQYDPTEVIDGDIAFATGFLPQFDFDRSDGIGANQFDFVAIATHEIGHILGFVSAVDDVDFALSGGALRDIEIQPLDLFRVRPGSTRALDFNDAVRILDTDGDQVVFDGGIFDPTGIPISGLQRGDIPMSTGAATGDGQQASHFKDDIQIAGIFLGMMDPTLSTGVIQNLTNADKRMFDLIGYDVVSGFGEPADWRSVKLEQFSHDRNVAVVTEFESPNAAAVDENGVGSTDPGTNTRPERAQFLGDLAAREKTGDDNARLAFEVHGLINQPGDVDVYSFSAEAGTEVWFDIDRTTHALDTVVELIENDGGDGVILAQSDDSYLEGIGQLDLFVAQAPPAGIAPVPDNHVNPLGRSSFGHELQSNYVASGPKDFYSTNPSDAGMRVVLPGPVGQRLIYYVRVRGSNLTSPADDRSLLQNPANLFDGVSTGVYQMQVRLRELDEVPGSMIQGSEIRFATNGIELQGVPGHSPLAGEASEFGDTVGNPINDVRANAIDLGNILNTDRGALAVSGNLSNPLDVDWYTFTVDYSDVQSIVDPFNAAATFNNPLRILSTIFDIDFADGTGKPNTNLSVYNAQGELIYLAGRSNIADDLPRPLKGADVESTERGSFGVLDPYLGPVNLQAADPLLEDGRYYVAVTSNALLPQEFDQFRQANAVNPLVRVEPVNSVDRIVSTNFDPDARSTVDAFETQDPPQVPIFIDPTNLVPWTLGDVTLYVSFNGSSLAEVNPFTGAFEESIGFDQQVTTPNRMYFIDDIAHRLITDDVPGTPDDPYEPFAGDLFALAQGPIGPLLNVDNRAGNFLVIDDHNAQATVIGDDNIITYEIDPANPPNARRTLGDQMGDGIQFSALGVFSHKRMYAFGNRGLANPIGVTDTKNIVYLIDIDPLSATYTNALSQATNDKRRVIGNIDFRPQGAGTDVREIGFVDTQVDFKAAVLNAVVGDVASKFDPNTLTTLYNIPDGTRFTVESPPGSGANTPFEFDSGPDANFNLIPNETLSVRDGDFFEVDNRRFEIDTGPVLVVAGNSDGDQIGGNFVDGDQFFIISPDPDNIGPNARTKAIFEFDNDGNFRTDSNGNKIANAGISFTSTSTRGAMISAITTAINAAVPNFPTSAQTLPGTGRISLVNRTGAPFASNVNDDSDAAVIPVYSSFGGMRIEGAIGASVAKGTDGFATQVLRVEEVEDELIVVREILDPASPIDPLDDPTPLQFPTNQFPSVNSPAGTANGVVPGAFVNRVNFSGANRITQASFFNGVGPGKVFDFQNRPIRVAGALQTGEPRGGTFTGAIPVPFLAHDTQTDIVSRMQASLIGAGFNTTVTQTAVGVNNGRIILADPPLNKAAVGGPGGGPQGGNITGMHVFPDLSVFVVTDAGSLFRLDETFVNINNGQAPIFSGRQIQGDWLANIVDDAGNPITFEGLEGGPLNTENGIYSNTLFGISGDGRLTAFNKLGEQQPIFYNGNTTVQVPNLGGVTGLTFSVLDENLWSITPRATPQDRYRQQQTGHGVDISDDQTRALEIDPTTFYQPNPNKLPFPTPGFSSLHFGNGRLGVPIFNAIDLPGGAHGSVETNTFSLEGYSIDDQPFLYFTYFLDTQNYNSTGTFPNPDEDPELMRDAFRVFITDDTGEWDLLVTNNSNIDDDEELDLLPRLPDGQRRVQEAFDNTGNWRQVRVPLEQFVGKDNLRLRFDFSTGADMQVGDALTVGDEIRIVDAGLMRDGQTMTVNSIHPFYYLQPVNPVIGTEVFEIDKGFTLVAPSGGNIPDGATFTITAPSEVNHFVPQRSTDGLGVGGLNSPRGLTFGPDDNLYVSSTGNSSVHRYNGATGAFMGVFATGGGLADPRDLTFGPDGDLYVVSRGDGAVKQYDGTSGGFLGDYLPAGTLRNGSSLAFGPDGHLYVNQALQPFAIERYQGPLAANPGAPLPAPGQTGAVYVPEIIDIFNLTDTLDTPDGIAFGPDGHLYVNVNGRRQVSRFEGPLLSTGAPNPTAGDPLSSTPGTLGNLSVFVQPGAGGLFSPRGLTFGNNGDLYLTDNVGDSVLRYSGIDGQFVEVAVNSNGGGLIPVGGIERSGGIDPPDGLAFGPDGGLYVANNMLNSVVEFAPLEGFTYEFDSNGINGGVNVISYSPFNTPAEIGQAMRVAINAGTPSIDAHIYNHRLNLEGVVRVSQNLLPGPSQVQGAPQPFIEGVPGVADGNIPIAVDDNMPTFDDDALIITLNDIRLNEALYQFNPGFFSPVARPDVRDTIAQALADVYVTPFTPSTTYERNVELMKRNKATFDLVGHDLFAQDPGPIVDLATGLPAAMMIGLNHDLLGDQNRLLAPFPVVGAQDGIFRHNGHYNEFRNRDPGVSRASQDNVVEGVYIDDIIIGFTERGEMITDANGNNAFLDTLILSPPDIQTGDYDLEIRPGDQYSTSVSGITNDGHFQTLDPDTLAPQFLIPGTGLDRSFDTNDRLARGMTLVAPGGHDVADGQTFVLSDGVDSLTFEFDDVSVGLIGNGVGAGNVQVPFIPSAPDYIMAQVITDVINDATFFFNGTFFNQPFGVQQVLELSAGLSDGKINPFADGVTGVTFIDPIDGRVRPISTTNQVNLYTGTRNIADIPVHVEPNDTIFEADATNLQPGGTTTFIASGTIGDNPTLDFATNDIDYYQISLGAGQQVRIDIDSFNEFNTLLDSLVAVFDANGNLLAFNDDALAPGESRSPTQPTTAILDSYLEFTSPAAGVYFVAVSSSPEFAPPQFSSPAPPLPQPFKFGIPPVYNPLIQESLLGQNPPLPPLFPFHASQGDYDLLITTDAHNNGIQVLRFENSADENRLRDQGQVIINSNLISDVLGFGIIAAPGSRDGDGGVTPAPGAAGALPHQGPVRNLREANVDNLVPGVVLENNLIVNAGQGGIRLDGDTTTGPLRAPAPFARVLNNTIYGNGRGLDTGILVGPGASPTLLNNIVANLGTGINVDPNSANTVVSGSVFHITNTPAIGPRGQGDFPIVVPDTAGVEDLFRSPDERNFYLVDNSQAIDASVESLQDRDSLRRVRQPLGIGLSPIKAPETDAFGQVRVDDPNVSPPPGVGFNVFVDRGAIEHADIAGPVAELVEPQDNDAAGNDQSAQLTIVELPADAILRSFRIRIRDGVAPTDAPNGTGPNDFSVSAGTIEVKRGGVVLQQGVDYRFTYDANSNIITLTPLTGIWLPGPYLITLDNGPGGIEDLAGNSLQPNQLSGETNFTIILGIPSDFGDAPDPVGGIDGQYPTLLVNDGPRHLIDFNVRLGDLVDPDADGQPNLLANGDGIDEDGVNFTGFRTTMGTPVIVAGAVFDITVNASTAGFLDAWVDFDRNGVFSPLEQIFTSRPMQPGDNVFSLANGNGVPIPITADPGTSYARFRFSSVGGLAPTGQAPDGEVEDYVIEIRPAAVWQNQRDPLDVDDNGFINTLDALILISYLRNNNGGGPLPVPPVPGFSPPPFLDVDGNNIATNADALRVIAEIRNTGGGRPANQGASGESAAQSPAESAPGPQPVAAGAQAKESSADESPAENSGDNQQGGELASSSLIASAANSSTSAAGVSDAVDSSPALVVSPRDERPSRRASIAEDERNSPAGGLIGDDLANISDDAQQDEEFDSLLDDLAHDVANQWADEDTAGPVDEGLFTNTARRRRR